MAHQRFRRSGTPRRQWGTERDTTSLPTFHARPSLGKLVWARLAIWITIVLWALYMLIVLVALLHAGTFPDVWQLISTFSYLTVVTFLTFSAVMYLLARTGAFERFARHSRVPRLELDAHFSSPQTPLTVLVPSYAEEPALVRKTLWSAALQEYPDLRIVLLLDDDPHTTNETDAATLMRSRSIAAEITDALAGLDARFARALRTQERREAIGEPTSQAQMLGVAGEYRTAEAWLRTRAEQEPHGDHLDASFIDDVLLTLARDLASSATAVETAAAEGEKIAPHRLTRAAAAPREHLPRRGHLLRAQALRLAVARTEQGDEPQRLHRPDGRALPRDRDAPRARSPAGGGGTSSAIWRSRTATSS